MVTCMTADVDPTPLEAIKGLQAYEHAVTRYRSGAALEALTGIKTVTEGIDTLAHAAVALARRQGASWGVIGDALGVSRQNAQSRFGQSAANADPPAGSVPPAELVDDELLLVPDYPGATKGQKYPVKVWDLADGDRVAIVSDVWGNTSLMNASERIWRTIHERWPNSHVLERWPADDTITGTPGAGGRYAWSTGNGGNIAADLDDLARRGLDLRI